MYITKTYSSGTFLPDVRPGLGDSDVATHSVHYGGTLWSDLSPVCGVTVLILLG